MKIRSEGKELPRQFKVEDYAPLAKKEANRILEKFHDYWEKNNRLKEAFERLVKVSDDLSKLDTSDIYDLCNKLRRAYHTTEYINYDLSIY